MQSSVSVLRTRLLAGLAAAAAGRGADDGEGAGAQAARFLPADAQQVFTISLDYDGEDWEAIKRLYARVARTGAIRDFFGSGMPVPPTLDGALDLVAGAAGLSFRDDIHPLLGGDLLIATSVEPAPPLPEDARRLLERLDESATEWREDEPRYFDRDGNPLPAGDVDDALRARDRLRPRTRTVIAQRRGCRRCCSSRPTRR